MGITKQYELGYADLFSLEPTDESMRPLRLKQYVRDPDYLESVKDNIEELEERQRIANKQKKGNLERIESKA